MSWPQLFNKPGWAILKTYSDGSSGLWSDGLGMHPNVWPSYLRFEAVEQAKKLKEPEIHLRVVKVKVTWPQIIS